MAEGTANAPELPAALLISKPRPVRLTAGGYIVTAITALLVAAVVLIAVLLSEMAARMGEIRARFEREAMAGEAEVLAIGPRRGKQGSHTVSYRYVVGGREHTGRATLQRGQSRGLRMGSRLPIRYLPSEPWVSYPAPGPAAFPPWVVPLVVVPLALAGAAILRSVRGQRRLLSDGRAAMARVTDSRRSSHGRRRLTLEFRTLSGAAAKVTVEYPKRDVPEFLPVVYDPERPRKAAIYPLALVRIARPR